MADENVIISAKVRLEIAETEKKIAYLERQLKKAMSSGDLHAIDRLDQALDRAKRHLAELNSNLEKTKGSVKTVEQEFKEVDSVAGKLARTMAGVFSLKLAKDFTQKIVETRGQFQQLEVAFQTLLGNKEKADKLMAESLDLAAKTPFFVSDVAAGAKQLLAYGTSADTVIETLRRCGDVAAGLSVPLQRIVSIYGRVQAQGKLTGRTLIQFTSAGIPIVKQLATQLSKTEQQVRQMITAGKIGFPMIKQAFVDMTNEGGKFGNLMEKQSKTITGRISVLKGLIEQMFNNIGKSTEGPIGKAIDAATTLVKNYEKVGKALGAVAVAYGVERAAVMVYIATQKVATSATMKDTLETIKNAGAKGGATAAQTALNKAILSSPYVWAAAAVAALGVGIYRMATHASAAAKAQNELSESVGKVAGESAKELADLKRLRAQLDASTKGAKSYEDAKNRLIAQFGKYNSNLKVEIENENARAQALDKVAESIKNVAKARVYETYVSTSSQKISDELGKTVPKIKERLEKHLSPEEAGGLYQQILDYIYGDTDELDRSNWSPSMRAAYTSNIFQEMFGTSLPTWVKDARADFKALQTLEKDAKAMFGVDDDFLKKYGTPQFTPTPDNVEDSLTDKEKRLMYNREKKLEEERKKLTREQIKARQADTQSEIDAMKEGSKKKIAQAELDYDKEIMAIQQAREDERQRLEQLQKDEWLAGGKDRQEFQFVPDEAAIDEQMKAFEDILTSRMENAGRKYHKKIEDIFVGDVEQYGSFDARLANLTRKWMKTIEDLDPEFKKGAQKLMRKELEDLVEELAQSGENVDFTKFYNSLADKSIAALEKALENAKEYLEVIQADDNIDSQTLALAQAKIVALEKKIRELSNQVQTSTVNWKELGEVAKSAASAFKDAGEAIGGATGELFNFMGGMASAIVDFAVSVKAVKDANSAIEAATAGISAVSAAASILSFIIKTIREEVSAADAAAKATRDYKRALKELADTRLQDEYKTIFGTDYFGSAIAFSERLKESKKDVDSLAESMRNMTSASDSWWEVALRMMLPFTATANWVSLFSGGIKNGNLVADNRTWLEKMFGVGQNNIQVANYEDFLDDNGNFDGEKLKAWYEKFGQGLEAAQKDAVEGILDEWNRYTEAAKGVNDYLTSLFGNTADTISDKMIDAFIETGDAMTGLEDIASQVGRNIAKSMVTSMLINNVFDPEAQKQMQDMIMAGNTSGAVAFFNELLGDAEDLAPKVTEFLKSLNIDWEGERQGAAKGIAQASQDSVNELNGRATVIQQHTYEINDSVKAIRAQNTELVSTSASILLEVRGIHNDTNEMRGRVNALADYITGMSGAVVEMRSSLSRMQSEGVMMKR